MFVQRATHALKPRHRF